MRTAVAVISLTSQATKNIYLLTSIFYFSFFEKKFSVKTEKDLTKYRWYYTHTSSGLAHYLLCGYLLGTNLLQMKAYGNDSFAHRTFNLDYSLCCAWVSVEQSSVFTTRTCYMHFISFFHHRRLQSMIIIIWRAMEPTLYRFFLWNLHLCTFL